MKTLGDVAAFLKRNPGRELVVSYSERRKCFEVTYDRTPATSEYLDDALEGLSETLRRKDSGMTPKETAAPIHPAYLLKNNVAAATATGAAVPAWAQQTGSQHFATAPGTVTAACGTVTAAGGTCAVCNRAPRWSLFGGEMGCVDSSHPNWKAIPGTVYAFNCAGTVLRLAYDPVTDSWR